MGVVALVALLAGGPLGMCLAIAYGITHLIKVAKVDAEYAKQGKTPPSHALIQKWLDSRTAKGAKPQKIAKPGMWQYAWQRWQAMWEDLGEKHKEVRDQYKTAAATAKANGQVPPPRPTLKETLTGWKWHLDQLTAPAVTAPGPANSESPGVPASPVGPPAGVVHDTLRATPTRKSSPWTRPTPSMAPTLNADGTITPGQGFPTTGVCAKCGTARNLTAVGWCEPCVTEVPHGFCARCNGLMYRDGDVYRHGPNQGCDAVAPASNKVPPPKSILNPEPDPDRSNSTDMQGDDMTAATQSGEVTGIRSAVDYMSKVAETHTQHGGNEQIVGAMAGMNIGGGDVALVQQAQAASMAAAEMWTTAAKEIEAHNKGVREGYGSAPDAADKHAQLAE